MEPATDVTDNYDTNIISVAQLPKKPQWLLDWLDGLPVGSVVRLHAALSKAMEELDSSNN